MTVILAEDDAGLRLVCRLNLELEGYAVVEAALPDDVERALADDPNAVVLLDVRFGRHDGVALARSLRERLPGLRLALVSGDTRLEADDSARDLADGILLKPFDPDELVALVRQLATSEA